MWFMEVVHLNKDMHKDKGAQESEYVQEKKTDTCTQTNNRDTNVNIYIFDYRAINWTILHSRVVATYAI